MAAARRLPLGERDVLEVDRSRVVGAGPDQPVVAVLLEHVRGPARDPAHREDRRELVGRDAHRGVGRARVEIDVGEDVLLGPHHPHHRVEDLHLAGVTHLLAQLERQALQVLGPRVLHPVHTVAEPHDAGLVGERLVDPRVGLDRVLDLLHHQHDLLVGAAVERALECADAGHDRVVHVGQGGRGDARREGGGVELVVGVEDQRDVEGLGGERRRLLAAHHVQEVTGKVEPRVRGHRGLAAPDPLPGRHQGGQLGGQAQRLSQRGLAAVVGRVRIEGGERGHAGPDHLHRGRLLGEGLENRDQLRGELPVRGGGESLQVRVQLLARRQPALPEEEGHFLEGRVRHQIVDVVAPVDEAALAAVDETDLRRGDDDVLETGLQGIDRSVRHGVPALLGGGWKRLLLPYAPRDFKAALPYTAVRARARSRRGRFLRPPPDQRHPSARTRPLVRLGPLVRYVRGDAQVLPFHSRAFDAAVSQEGLLHVPDKATVLAECARVLKPGGRLAFSDWIARPRLADNERRRLFEWMAAVSLQSIDGYRGLLARAGFDGTLAEDLSGGGIAPLQQPLRMYPGLREQTVARLGQARYDEYNQLYC